MSDPLDSDRDSGSNAALHSIQGAALDPMTPAQQEEIEGQLPPENVELLRAILQLSGQPDLPRERLYLALLEATYLAPLARSLDPDQSEGDEVSLDVLSLTGPDGEMGLPVFTHQQALAQWAGHDQPAVLLPGAAIIQMMSGSPFDLMLVNPAGPFGAQVQRSEFDRIAREISRVDEGQAAPGASTDHSIFVDLPLLPLPSDTTVKLCSMMEISPAVQSAHLFLMQVGPDAAPRLTLGIHAEGPASQWVIPQLTRLLRTSGLSFEPYESPGLLLLDSVAGSEALRSAIPPLFLRTPVPDDPLSRGADKMEALDAGRGATASRDEGERIADAIGQPPALIPSDQRRPRRFLWPFKGRG